MFHCAGPTGVGLDELKRKLLISDPQHFSVTIPRKFTLLVWWTKCGLIFGGHHPVFFSFLLSVLSKFIKIVIGMFLQFHVVVQLAKSDIIGLSFLKHYH